MQQSQLPCLLLILLLLVMQVLTSASSSCARVLDRNELGLCSNGSTSPLLMLPARAVRVDSHPHCTVRVTSCNL